MTRIEEIQWEAGGIVNRMIGRGVSQCYDTYYLAFQEGAKWADKTMIEKAYKWILCNMPKYVKASQLDVFVNNEDMANDFKRAMEE